MKKTSLIRLSIASGLLAFALGACGNKSKEADKSKTAEPVKTAEPAKTAKPAEPVKTAAVEPDMEAAKKMFEERCVACHGSSGKGDGPGAAALKPKPRDYTDAEWQASVSDEDLTKVILGGGLAVGKSAIMPANPDLKGKPAIVQGLVNIIRDFE